MIPTRHPTLTGLPRLYTEPFPLVRRKGHDRPTLISRQTPTELPRACRLEVTQTEIVRGPDGTVFFRDRPHMVPLVTQTRLRRPAAPSRALEMTSDVMAAVVTAILVWAMVALLWQVMR